MTRAAHHILHDPRWVTVFCGFVFATAGGLFLRIGIMSLCWAICYAVTALWAYLHWRESCAILARCWVVFIPPIYYISATLWSIAPSATLTSSIQILVTTIIAARLATSISAERAMDLLALITFTALILSLANGGIGFFQPAWDQNDALLGIYTQKNGMGKAVVLAALACITACAQHRQFLLALIVGVGAFPIVLMTKSVGAEITYCALILFIPLLATAKTSATFRFQFTGLMIAFALLVLLAYLASGGNPVRDLLALTEKSDTLTGRTVIWNLGIERWREDMLFGIGHKSFWSYDTYALRYIHENVDDGLYWFHNIYVDILVAGGIVGAVICGGMLWVLVGRALRWYCATGQIAAIGWGMVLGTSMIAGFADDVMFTPHGFHHLLIVMGYVFALKATEGRSRRAPQIFERGRGFASKIPRGHGATLTLALARPKTKTSS